MRHPRNPATMPPRAMALALLLVAAFTAVPVAAAEPALLPGGLDPAPPEAQACGGLVNSLLCGLGNICPFCL